ncbi:MAG: hypothetical protein EHM58_13020 [Ignavibacteriae bacterium]|nr:MAG: hypothetical protein EHM58_13020 [Ignavibacteriota bacterium]
MKNIFLSIVILLVMENICYPQIKINTYTIKDNTSNFYQDTVIKKPSLKEPFNAGLLSFFVPGAGQFYNGETVNGAVRLGIAISCVTAFIVSPPFQIIGNVGGGTESEKSESNGNVIKIISFLGYTVNWVLAIVDASYSASHCNEKVLKEWNSRKFNMGFYFNKYPGVKITFNL